MKEPKIRFKGFEGEWEEKYLNSLASYICSGKNTNMQGPYPLYGSTGIIGSTDKPYHTGPMLLVARVGANAGYLQLIEKECGVSDNTLIIQPNNELPETYLFYYFVHLNLNRFIYGSGQPLITGGMLKKMPVRFGSTIETKKLASFFTTLDAQISASTSRLASLKQIKAASLQSMFPQEGETVPKLRFKGFKGEWEKIAIKDIAMFSKGRGYSKSDLRVNGTPIILYGRMYTKYETCITNVDTYVNPIPNSIYSLGNEVIMPASGETPEDISCASAVQARGIILGGDLNVLRFDTDCYDTTFIALSLSMGKTKKNISNMAQGKSVVHLHNSDIEKVSMCIPSFAEQQKIASFFTNLDRQITLQSQRLEKLKQIKAACLDKMFV